MHCPRRGGAHTSNSVAAVTSHQPCTRRGGKRKTYEEKRICGKEIGKHRPPDDAVHTDALADQYGQYRAEELVPAVPQQVQQLAVAAANAQQICTQLQNSELKEQDGEGGARGLGQLLGVKVAPDTGQKTVEEDVGHEGHEGDVEVGRVDVVARREEGILEGTVRGGGGAGGGGTEPGLVREGEEEDAEFCEDVGVGYEEVRFESGDVAVELFPGAVSTLEREGGGRRRRRRKESRGGKGGVRFSQRSLRR